MTNFSLEAELTFNLSLVGNRSITLEVGNLGSQKTKVDNAIFFCFMFQAYFASNNIVLLDRWAPV